MRVKTKCDPSFTRRFISPMGWISALSIEGVEVWLACLRVRPKHDVVAVQTGRLTVR